MFRKTAALLTIMDAKAANGIGTPQMVEDFSKLIFQLGTASNCNCVVKFQGSNADTMPTFSSAQSVANPWDYIDVIDLEDGASVDGDTGITLSGTDDFRNFEVNAGGFKWVCAIISGYAAGAVTLKLKVFYE